MGLKPFACAALAAVLCLTLAGQTFAAGTGDAETPPEAPVTTEAVKTRYGITTAERTATFPDGDVFSTQKIEREAGNDAEHVVWVDVAGTSGTVRYYDAALAQWKTVPLANGKLPSAVLFIETNKESLICGPASLYRPMGSTSYETIAAEAQTVTVGRHADKFRLAFRFRRSDTAEGQLWTLRSSEKLVEWNAESEALWKRLNFAGAHRILYDGAYYTTPADYGPYSPAMIWRNPAVFPAGVLTEASGRATEKLCVFLLDRAVENQTESGLWTTAPASSWLKRDYGVEAGFYDTRFNCDVTLSLFRAYENTGYAHFRDAALKAADYLAAHAAKNNFAAASGGVTGILVSDYAHPEKPHEMTHASLNHHVTEVIVLLRAFEISGTETYKTLALSMLNGVKATASKWIMPDSNLYYAMKPGGEMVPGDYPELTYNDMYSLQTLLEKLLGARDGDIDRLMAAKKQYMDNTGVKTYTGYTAQTPAA
ncbi:hypothetical protein LJC32_06585 [Oscillospiraceae bacterium OttesenSCG-928-F05]|nr:hypothetical protein [Oscillospiraceae bacterium OttesenSCG-928-F05]